MINLRKFSYVENNRTVGFLLGHRECNGEVYISCIEETEIKSNIQQIKIFVADDAKSETLWKKITLMPGVVSVLEYDWKKQIIECD